MRGRAIAVPAKPKTIADAINIAGFMIFPSRNHWPPFGDCHRERQPGCGSKRVKHDFPRRSVLEQATQRITLSLVPQWLPVRAYLAALSGNCTVLILEAGGSKIWSEMLLKNSNKLRSSHLTHKSHTISRGNWGKFDIWGRICGKSYCVWRLDCSVFHR